MLTSYQLEVTKLPQQKASALSLEDLIATLKKEKLSQKEITKRLQIIQHNQEDIDETYIIGKLLTEYEEAAYALDKDAETREKCKWYDHDDELKEFSKKFPTWLFTLCGEGEEPGDIWKEYFVNGKMQKEVAKFVIDDFDMTKLK
jgi:hypothetical protein